MLHLDTAHATASSSSSIIAYLDSALLKNRDPAWTSIHCPSDDCCWRTNPTPCLLASVQIRVGLAMSKNANVGALARCCLALDSACSWVVDQTNSFLELRRGCSGSKSSAILSVPAANWFARPKKDLRSVRVVGGGNLVITLVIAGSIRYPSIDK